MVGLNLEALTIASIRRTLIVHTGSEGMNEARVELLDTKKLYTHVRCSSRRDSRKYRVDSSSVQHYVGAVAL